MKLAAFATITILFLCGLWWALQPATAYPSYLAGIQAQLTATAQQQDLVRETALKDALLPFQTVALAALYLAVPVVVFGGLGYAVWYGTRRPLVHGPATLPAPTFARPLAVEYQAPKLVPTAPTMPAVTTYGSLGHLPMLGILLALGSNGQRLTAPIGNDLCHLIITGATGNGKTNTSKLIALQFAALGIPFWLLDLKFRPADGWEHIAARSVPGRAITEPAEILDRLRWFAEVELPRRRAAWNTAQPTGDPTFIFIEEAPYLAGKEPRFMAWVSDLLRLGRDFGLYIIMFAQDTLVKTLGGSVGDQGNLKTAYYLGGEPISGRRVMQGEVLEPTQRGMAWLRAAPTHNLPQQVRVPLVSAACVAQALARSGETARIMLDPLAIYEDLQAVSPFQAVAEPECLGVKRSETVARMRQGGSQGEIVGALWPTVKPGGGKDYIAVTKFLAETQQWLAQDRP